MGERGAGGEGNREVLQRNKALGSISQLYRALPVARLPCNCGLGHWRSRGGFDKPTSKGKNTHRKYGLASPDVGPSVEAGAGAGRGD